MKSVSLETIKVKLIDQNNNSLYNTEFTHYDLDLYNVAIFFSYLVYTYTNVPIHSSKCFFSVHSLKFILLID